MQPDAGYNEVELHKHSTKGKDSSNQYGNVTPGQPILFRNRPGDGINATWNGYGFAFEASKGAAKYKRE
jgi:hypothetical protein